MRGSVLNVFRIVRLALVYIVLAAVFGNGIVAPVFAARTGEADMNNLNPELSLARDSMRALGVHLTMFHFYTLNMATPGYIETGGQNRNIDGKLDVVPFYRWRAGPVKETNKPLDFALSAGNKGFFTVALPFGVGYTRDGRFTINITSRRLELTAGGYPVLGEAGEIFIPETDDISVTRAGTLFVDGDPIDRLRISVFSDLSNLVSINGSIFYADGPAKLNPNPIYAVKQGFIEQSNVLKGLTGDILLARNVYDGVTRSIKTMNKSMRLATSLASP